MSPACRLSLSISFVVAFLTCLKYAGSPVNLPPCIGNGSPSLRQKSGVSEVHEYHPSISAITSYFPKMKAAPPYPTKASNSPPGQPLGAALELSAPITIVYFIPDFG